MADGAAAPRIYVLAGTNGAGKSSIGGATFRHYRSDYFNPDEAARHIRGANPAISVEDANAAAWQTGKRLLERAIAERLDFNFETTLGGNTITALLERACSNGFEVRIWYVGLVSPELHIKRVRARVATGGHDIPDDMIRKRYDSGRENLIRLLPSLTELRVFDNSAEATPSAGKKPRPVLLLRCRRGKIVEHVPLADMPQWAKPIAAAAMKLAR